jgi:hypothetical protein
MGGVPFQELADRNRENSEIWLNPGDPKEDWRSFCREFERVYPEIPQEQFWPNKFRRFWQRSRFVVASEKNIRGHESRVKSIDRGIFHEECGVMEEPFDCSPLEVW